ncbi:hypothetical protein [Sphingobacterium faecium]
MAKKQYAYQKYLQDLGKQIKKIRDDNGWSQELLAELCEIDVR